MLDQFVFAPTFIPTFMASLMILEGNASAIPDKLRSAWWPTIRANWGLWIPAQIVNFAFIPPTHQVLFSNSVGFVWNTILSFMAFQKDQQKGPSS